MRVAAALAVLALAFTPDASAARHSACAIPRAHVVAKGTRVVVLRRDRSYWACLSASGIRRRLDVGGWDVAGHFRLAGRFAGYIREGECYDSCTEMVSLDVRSGRRLTSDTAGNFHHVVLDARGRVVWVTDEATRELHRMDSDGEDVIDSGPGIDPQSVAIRDGSVFWSKEGEARSAPLDAHPSCAARDSSTIARTAEVRVYSVPLARDEYFGDVYGCALTSGRVTKLGGREVDTYEYYGGGFVYAAGHFATIEEGSRGRGGASADLSVYNLETGQRVRRWQCCQGGDWWIDAVVLHPSGAVAWMYGGSANGSTHGTYAVAKSDSTGEDVVLASTDQSNIHDRESFRLAGDVVSWTLNGTPGSAQLR